MQPETHALIAQLPKPQSFFGVDTSKGEAKGAPADRRFHVFSEGRLRPVLNARTGKAAVGVVVVDAQGRTCSRSGRFIGNGTNNIAEMNAILYGLTVSQSCIPDPGSATLVLHTDSKFAYNALRYNSVSDHKHVVMCLRIHEQARKFGRVIFQHDGAANHGIRAAESEARKALQKGLQSPVRPRGSKGKKRAGGNPPWNPFEGDANW